MCGKFDEKEREVQITKTRTKSGYITISQPCRNKKDYRRIL